MCGITGATRDVVGGGGPTLGLGFEFFWVSVISGAKEDFIESPFASFGGPGGGGPGGGGGGGHWKGGASPIC